MSLWRQLIRGLRVLTHRTAADREIADELQHFYDEACADLERAGLPVQAARRQARLAIGQTAAVREEVRASGWENGLWTLLMDIRYGLRGLRRNPGFAVVSVLTLALGIGASTAIGSAIKPILFDSLPYPDPSHLVAVWYGGADGSRAMQSFATYRELLARARTFDAFSLFKPWQPAMAGSGEPERFDGQRVTAEYFQVLGVRPALGGDLNPADDRRGGPNVVILADRLWRRRFSADPTVIGRAVKLDGDLYTVIGVMPASFENVLAPAAEIWGLLQYDPSLPPDGREWGHHLHMVARMRHGSRLADARRDLDTIARSPIAQFPRQPGSTMNRGFIVVLLQEDVTRAVKPALVAVLGAVLLVLLIACVNVTNLLLARSAQRKGEFALRVALGAGRRRIARQLITEALLLAFIGGGLGLALANLGVEALLAVSPAGLPRASAMTIDRTAFLLALAITTAVGLLVGLIPAVRSLHGDVQAGLPEASLRTTAGHRFTRRTLVVAEVALAVVLLVGAGLLLRSLSRLFAIAPGFDTAHLLTMQVQVASTDRFHDPGAYHRFFSQAADAVRQVPGVSAVALTGQLPLSGDDPALEIYKAQLERDGSPPLDTEVSRYAVSPSYFDAMRIPLLRGRLFTDREGGPSRPVVISDSYARRAFRGHDPIGRRIRFGGLPGRPWDTIVGVVGDVKQGSLGGTQVDAVYVDAARWLWADNPLWLVVRTRGDAPPPVAAIRSAIWSIDKDQPITRIATMDSLLAASEASRRFVLILLEGFATAALALAAIGLYGVVAGSVTERTREIGIRIALGASPRDVMTLIVRQGMALTAIGMAVGLAGAAVSSRAVATLLFGVSRLDPETHAGVLALLIGVSVLACWVPARRAVAIDPAVTLRAE